MKDSPESAPESSDSTRTATGRTSRRLRVDENSPFALALASYRASDRTQLAELAATAEIFMSETIATLGLLTPTPDDTYRYASIAETADRFRHSTDITLNPEGLGPKGLNPTSPGTEKRATVAVAGTPIGTEEVAGNPASLPNFPRFRLASTISGWVHQHAQPENISEFAAVRASTTARTYAHITTAMTLIHGLPGFHLRTAVGDFTIEHVLAAARICRDVRFEHLPALDHYLARRPADVTIETFKKTLSMKVAATQPMEERIESISARRRVDISTGDDGTAYLTLTGPAPELHACYRRVEAFARAIHTGNTDAFGRQLRPGEAFDDDRGINALMFDILSRTLPQLKLRIKNATQDEAWQTGDCSADVGQDGARLNLGGQDGAELGLWGPGGAGRTFEGRAGTGRDVDISGLLAAQIDSGTFTPAAFDELLAGYGAQKAYGAQHSNRELVLFMPTHAQWLAAQAKVTATVPFLTLAGRARLPGQLPDGSPIPAEMAKQLASYSKSWTRILTDPATGTPVDAKAITYQIPDSVRRTLNAQWIMCTIPGCTRKAETSEIDHIIPFDHADPEAGGLTRFGNLHTLCKLHHQAKTDRKYQVRALGPCRLEYVFRHGVTTEVRAPDNPINAAHARLFAQLPPDADFSHLKNQKPPPQDIVGNHDYIGKRIFSPTRPGPAPHDGLPGWSEYPEFLAGPRTSEEREWFWTSGEEPPF